MIFTLGIRKWGIALLGVTMLAFSLSSAQAADPRATSFLQDIDVVQGQNNQGNLDLQSTVNRAEFMKVLADLASAGDLSTANYGYCFPDVNDEWYAAYVCWAHEHGYVDGYPDGYFRPGNLVTHAEVMKVLNEVFDFDFETFENIADRDLWYDIYAKSTLHMNLASDDVLGKLAEPATRGEVFEYIFRAFAVAEQEAYRFDEQYYETLPSQYQRGLGALPAPTAEQDELLSIIKSQIEYGFQPQSEQTTASFYMKLDQPGSSISVDVSTDGMEKIVGTKDTLEKYEGSLTLHAVLEDDNQNTGMMKIDMSAELKLAFENNMVYAQLADVVLNDVEGDPMVEFGVNQVLSELEPYIGVWYKVDLAQLQQEVGEDMSVSTIDTEDLDMILSVVRNFMLHHADGIKISKLTQFNSMTGYNIAVTPETLGEIVTLVRGEVEGDYNKYAHNNDMRAMRRIFKQISDLLSVDIFVDPTTYLLKKVDMSLDTMDIIHPKDDEKTGTFAFELHSTYEYPSSLTIDIPTEATDVSELAETLPVF